MRHFHLPIPKIANVLIFEAIGEKLFAYPSKKYSNHEKVIYWTYFITNENDRGSTKAWWKLIHHIIFVLLIFRSSFLNLYIRNTLKLDLALFHTKEMAKSRPWKNLVIIFFVSASNYKHVFALLIILGHLNVLGPIDWILQL